MITPTEATEKAAIVQARITRMLKALARARASKDDAAVATIRANLRTAREALRVCTCVQKGRPLP